MSVLLEKPPAPMETVNDLDESIMNFWRVFRRNPKRFAEVCFLTPHSRREHQDSRKSLRNDSQLERARKFWVLVTQGRSGRYYHASGWRHYKRGCNGGPGYFSMTKILENYVERFTPVLERIKHVSLECRPALEVVKEYGQFPGNLLYLDPPYVLETRKGRKAYKHEMEDRDHQALLEAALECKAMVFISGYQSALYARMLQGWDRVEFQSYSGNSANQNEVRTEVLWANCQMVKQGELFEVLA